MYKASAPIFVQFLRHFAQLRRRGRQTRLYGHAGHVV